MRAGGPVFVVGERNAERGDFEVNVGGGRRRSAGSGKRGVDCPRQRLRPRQTLHLHAVDV